MGNRRRQDEEGEEAQAQVDIWKYVFGFTEAAVIKCAIGLGIAYVLESQPGQAMTLDQLSSSLSCSPSLLYRIMRFLTNRGIFKLSTTTNKTPTYSQTPLSRLLARDGEKSMAALLLFLNSPPMIASWHGLRERVLGNAGGGGGGPGAPFDEANGGHDIWEYSQRNPDHRKLLNDAMSCHARFVVSKMVGECREVFEGIGTLVDVGGADGAALRNLLKALPSIRRGINFDLPHVVADAPLSDGLQHVGGSMFDAVPNADAAFLMWVLHDWGDDECITILKNCREAVSPGMGKVMIVEEVIDDVDDDEEGGGDDRLKDVGLRVDMCLMAFTIEGKLRTAKEWDYILDKAGFSRHTVKSIQAADSVIEAYV